MFFLAKSAELCYDTIMDMNEILKQLPAPLLAWYRENARDLPWRRTRDPYRIWVSEIMLQQTRVVAVLGYYDRFLKAFPTVRALAEALEEQLLKCWEGLGYYSRARNLQKAANVIVNEHGGAFPETYEALLKLPGIGEYTAGAIASSAFAQPVPAVDGNVLRVVSRITNCYDDVADLKVRKRFRNEIAEIFPEEEAAIRIFNQALMELGATVCVPNGAPKCANCPAAGLCEARKRGTWAELPVKAPKKERRVEEKTVFLLFQKGRIALRKRENKGLLAGLWEFPNVPGRLDEAQAQSALRDWGVTAGEWKKQLAAKHIFTHVEWHMSGYVLDAVGNGPSDFFWVDLETLKTLAVPSAFARYYQEAVQTLSE